ncbi:MAG: hypothetical protein H7Y11_15375 [Armatimonadetes bacterium]|nr:hypothetical protein [Anaerolineae bacterium]
MQITQLTLRTADINQLYPFYAEVLGLPMLTRTDSTFTVQIGASQLVFVEETGFTGLYHTAFNIPENQFPAAVAWLTHRVPLIATKDGTTQFHTTDWNAHNVYFYDSAGNILELIARHDLPSASDEPFWAHRLLNISEVALAAADSRVLAAQLKQAMPGLTIFRNSQSDHFNALGDDEGMFIVVTAGREWYPETGKTAGLFPVEAVVVHNGTHYTVSSDPLVITQA